MQYAALDVSQASLASGLEFVPGQDDQRVRLEPKNTLRLYFPCDEAVGDCPQDALYGVETLSPNWGAAVHVAAESGFGYRLDNTGNAPYHSFIGSFVTQLLTDINEWTFEFRFKTPGALADGMVVGVGYWALGNLSYFLKLSGTNLILYLSTNGTNYTGYACSGLTIQTSTDYHIRVSYKYLTNGTSLARLSIDGANYLNATNAIGPLYSTPGVQFHLGAMQGHATQHYTGFGIAFLFDEVLFYGEQLGLTYTKPTAPHAPYLTSSPVVTFASSDAGVSGATWDLSTLAFDGSTTDMEFRVAANDSGSGFSYSAWGDLIATQARTDPTGRWFSIQARLTSATGAQSPTLCSGRIEVSVPAPSPPAGQPTLDSLTDEGSGAVKAWWTPGDTGTTGKLYARAVPAKTWPLVGSGSSSPIDGTGLAEGVRYEFIVEEFEGDFSGLATNAVRRTLGSSASIEGRVQEAVLAVLRADPALAARVPGDWTEHVLDGARRRLDARRSLGRMPYLEVGPVELRGQDELSSEHAAAEAACVVRARGLDWTGTSSDFHDLLGDVLKALAAEPRLTIPGQVAGLSARYGRPEYRRPVWSADVTLSIRLCMDPESRGEVTP